MAPSYWLPDKLSPDFATYAARQSVRVNVENGVIKHPSGKQGRFGAFAEKANQMPVPADPKLKDPSQFKFIGKEGVVKPCR